MLIEKPPKWFRALFPGAIFRLRSERGTGKRIFLTFDDGPVPEVTPWVLDVLDRYGVKATFFMVGQNVERHPELLEEVRKRGHGVGNHTLHHMKAPGNKTERYMEDVEKGKHLTGSCLFRPPHGWLGPFQLKALKKRGHVVVMYDVVTRDYSRHLTADDVVNNVKKYVRDGSVVVFHDSLKSWPRLQKALPQSLAWLCGQGFDFALFESNATS